MVSTIMVYKFKAFSRDELDAMLGIDLKELKQTRVYQEALEEGQQSLVLIQARVQSLEPDRLKELGAALLDFTNLVDLENWLQQ
jgi:predicted transposase YdaD